MKFRKKPVVIDAAQFDGSLSSLDSLSIPELSQELTSDTCQIVTLEGVMTASKGDWVIRGVKGEHYPCKPDIFAATYDAEPVSTLPPHQQRVVDEHAELAEKSAKLEAFIGTPIYCGLPSDEQARLAHQFGIMESYCDVLAERIAAF